MNSRILIHALVLCLAVLGTAPATGAVTNVGGSGIGCETRAITATTTDFFFPSLGYKITFQVEPDTSGAGATVQVQTSGCTETIYDADSCLVLEYDTDGDGLPDTSVWTGVGDYRGDDIGKAVAGGILFDAIVAPGVGETAQLTMCRVN